MYWKFLAIAAIVSSFVAAVCNPVAAGSLVVGGEVFTEYSYETSQGKEEAPVTRVHGGSFKVGSQMTPRLGLILQGNSERVVGSKESETELGLILSYDLGGGWKLSIGDDYIWRLERQRPEDNSLSQILNASIIGQFGSRVFISLAGKKTREWFYERPEKNGMMSEVSLASSWKPLKDIFINAEIVRATRTYEGEPWRDYAETKAKMKITGPLWEGVTGTLEGEVVKKEFPDGDMYSDYERRSFKSGLKWKVTEDLTLTLGSEFLEKVVWQDLSSNYRKRGFNAEVERRFGSTITLGLRTSIVRKDFPNVEWGSSDYRQHLFGMGIKNRLLSDLTFSLDVERKEKSYFKKDAAREEETSLAIGFEKVLSDATELDIGLERVKKVKGTSEMEQTFETILKAKLTHVFSEDIKAALLCSYSTTEEEHREIRAEIKYSFE